MKYLLGKPLHQSVLGALRWVHLGRHTGTLEMVIAGSRRRLYLVSGELYLSDNSPLAARFVWYLHRLGTVGPPPRPIPATTHQTLQIQEELRELVSRIARHITDWRVESFRFIEGLPQATPELVGPLPTSQILVEAADLSRLQPAVAQETVAPQPEPEVKAPVQATPPPSSPAGAETEAEAGWITESFPEQPPHATEHEAIWRHHFRLEADPFSLTPDPSFLYLSESHKEALAGLKLGLLERRGLTVMIGEVGTGKTTLVYSLLSILDPQVETAYVSNTRLPFDQVLQSVLKDFGLGIVSPLKVDLLESLNNFLFNCAERNKAVALVVDEAQDLSNEVFEELRLLLNLETYKRKLLQIVLVGQPELGGRLRQPRLRQIADRIAIRCELSPLSPTEARTYIYHRLQAVAGTGDLFTEPAQHLIVKKAEGIPRRINVLCHNALLFAYGRGLRKVDRATAAEAVREMTGTLRRSSTTDGNGRARPAPAVPGSGYAVASRRLLPPLLRTRSS